MTKIKWNPNSKRKLPSDLKYTRDKLIYQYRQEGWTLEKLGKMFGMTKERVRQILLNFEKRREGVLIKKDEQS